MAKKPTVLKELIGYTPCRFPKWIYFENGAKTLVKDEAGLKKYNPGWSDNPKGPFNVKEKKEVPDVNDLFGKIKGKKKG